MAAKLPFTEDDLRRAAGPASYARGLGYLNQVEDLEVTGTWVTATVFGTDAYQVRLRSVSITDYLDYREAGAYAGNIVRAAEAIEDLIDAGAADDAIDVARDAIWWLGQCVGMVDDSSGDIGSAAYELLHVHLLACRASPPDPVELAGYLADLYLKGEFSFTPSLAGYAELLGETGTAALRERVAAAYQGKPDDFHARYAMESVIQACGDVDALVAFYAAHLDERGWQQLRIARLLDGADRPDEALEWAERGLGAGPRPDDRLVEYLVDRYTKAGRAGDVLGLRRTLFAANRSLANFRALRETAIDSGTWDAERETALSQLRKDAGAVQRTLWLPWAGPVLVDALIEDGDLAAAWTAAQDTASEPQWIRLADASVTSRPADALGVYVKVIEGLTQNTGDAVYRKIATYLLATRACHEALGTMDKFRQYMVLLRMGQRRKRNLMAILDQNGL